tara:strand:+ start:1193 stop:1294 length:102 start_codon:yes stop_codon:yes gene_type:complete
MTDSADDPCDGIGSDTLSGWIKKKKDLTKIVEG